MSPQSIETQLAVISSKLDTLIEQRQDLESRVRVLEQWRWLVIGIAITLSTVMPFAVPRIAGA